MQTAMPRLLFLASLSVVCAFGCGKSDPRPAEEPINAEELAGRLGAAKGIHDVAEKDKALARVARDAADAGVAEIADQGLAAMHDVSVKDKAAYAAALRLAKAGKTEAAAATARAIHDVSLKDKTLAKIATGDTGE